MMVRVNFFDESESDLVQVLMHMSQQANDKSQLGDHEGAPVKGCLVVGIHL